MYRELETLAAPGAIEIVLHDGGAAELRLTLRLSPAGDSVGLEVEDDGVLDWPWLRGAVSAARFAELVAALRVVLALPPDESGAYDCGTHGCWILSATIDLPLRSGPLRREARATEGFSSLELLDPLEQLLREVAGLPGAAGVTFGELQRRQRVRWALLALLALASWARG